MVRLPRKIDVCGVTYRIRRAKLDANTWAVCRVADRLIEIGHGIPDDEVPAALVEEWLHALEAEIVSPGHVPHAYIRKGASEIVAALRRHPILLRVILSEAPKRRRRGNSR